MPVCTFSQNRLLYGVTCVDNLFLQEFLPRASGDAVRVYLYGLYCVGRPGAQASVEDIAHALDMDVNQVKTAFSYWERQGLILRTSDNPPCYEYQDVRSAMEKTAGDEQYYGLQSFNNRLQAILGTEKLLHPQDFSRAAEWVEDLGLPEDVVLMMVRAYVEKKKGRVSFAYLDKIAAAWAKEGVRTPEAAREILSRESAEYHLAQQVLSRFNLKRSPTEPEVELARKWLGEYHLTEKDVLIACNETVKGVNPSFGYVDSVLARHQDGGEAIEKDNRLRAAVAELLREMGLRSSPTPEQLEKYEKYLSAGFEPEAILETARTLGESGRASFSRLDGTLIKCMERNMYTLSDIQAYRARKAEAERMLAGYGLTRGLTDAETQMAEAWKAAYSPELIAAAAKRAVGAKNPVAYMNSVLTGWKEKGITDPKEALAETPQNKPPEGANFSQRSYSQDELDKLFVNLEGT